MKSLIKKREADKKLPEFLLMGATCYCLSITSQIQFMTINLLYGFKEIFKNCFNIWKEEICVSDQVPNPSRNNGRDEVNKSEVFGLAADA